MRTVFDVKLRVLAFMTGAFIYGVWGSPTPDGLGLVEGLVGLSLLVAVGVAGAREVLVFRAEDALWMSAGRMLCVFGVSVPVIVGVVNGAGALAVLRDVVPFLFMILPVFMMGVMRDEERARTLIILSVVWVGAAFSVRGVMGSDPLYYLANMPSVLMAGIMFGGAAMHVFVERFSVRALGVAVVFGLLAALVMWPVMVTQQRASVGAFAVAMILVAGRLMWLYPRRMAFVMMIVMAAVVVVWPMMAEGVSIMARKSRLVGFNMRFEEVAAVWAQIGRNPLASLFGLGWGGHFESPAVADIRVNFTHSLVSSALLKTGLVGLGCVALYLYGLGRVWCASVRRYPVMALAVGMPIAIDVFLYASFKSLDFGLVLLIVVVMGDMARDGKRVKGEGKASLSIAY